MRSSVTAILALLTFACFAQDTDQIVISDLGDGAISKSQPLNMTLGHFIGSLSTKNNAIDKDFLYVEPLGYETNELRTKTEVFSNTTANSVQFKVTFTDEETSFQLCDTTDKILAYSTLEPDTYESISFKEYEIGTYILTIRNGEVINRYRVVKN